MYNFACMHLCRVEVSFGDITRSTKWLYRISVNLFNVDFVVLKVDLISEIVTL